MSTFKKTFYYLLKNRLKKEIIVCFNNFIIVKKPAKVDFVINLTDVKKKCFAFKKYDNAYYKKVFERVSKNEIISTYLINILEFQLIVKNILLYLLGKDAGFMLHCSACKKNTEAILFLGSSGGGKTTIIKLLRKKYPSLVDDTGIIRKIGDSFYFYQTPFVEKEWKIRRYPQPYPIKKVFILKKANKFQIEKLEDKAYIFEKIIRQLLPSIKYYKKQEDYLFMLIRKCKFYNLFFTKDKIQLLKI